MDPIAESLNPLGKPINRRVPSPFVTALRSQLVRRFMACEQRKDTDHDGVGDRHERALLAPTCRQASICGEAAPFHHTRGWGGQLIGSGTMRHAGLRFFWTSSPAQGVNPTSTLRPSASSGLG